MKSNIILEYKDYKDITDRIDRILDKINDKGIKSLTSEEKALLDAHKEGGEKSISAFKNLSKKDKERTFINNDGDIEFHFTHMETNIGELENEVKIFGTMVFEDLPLENAETLDGNIKGYITVYDTGIYTPHFDKRGYTDFDFVDSEYINEYDDFLGEIVDELTSDYF